MLDVVVLLILFCANISVVVSLSFLDGIHQIISGEDLSKCSKENRANVCNNILKSKYEKKFTMEFSRDRKSMSVYCVPIPPKTAQPDPPAPTPKLFVKGAPESILDRCTHARVGKIFSFDKREGIFRLLDLLYSKVNCVSN